MCGRRTFTQIRTGEGWLLPRGGSSPCSAVGSSAGAWTGRHVRQEIVIDALTMAVTARKPDKGTIHHSDHGGQFIGLLFGQTCHDAGIAQSMGAVGTCYDNAVAETFFATLTKESLLHDPPPDGWATRAQAAFSDLRVHRGVLQPDQAAQHARDALPRRVRGGPCRRRSRRPRARPHARRTRAKKLLTT